MFAEEYLRKNNFQPAPGSYDETGMIVVIPCYVEPDIIKTLDSLSACKPPVKGAEVIVVVNNPENAPERDRDFNRMTVGQISRWKSERAGLTIPVHVLGPVDLLKKWAGAGLARKRGMDEAVYRFNRFQKPGGIILSLDADTLVDENYLTEVENHFSSHPGHVGATIAFSHQTEGLAPRHLEGISLYEKYMVYYRKAVTFTGYPYSMFTIGSAFAVTAGAYVKRGGMNRRKAGEDFYFLQNLAFMGKIGEISSTSVHPSARISGRVPFGTGSMLRRWMDGDEDLALTYNFNAFTDLKKLFDMKDRFYGAGVGELAELISLLPLPVSEFIREDNFTADLMELNRNCSHPGIFGRRFFEKFNAFKILKFLNYTHGQYYSKGNLREQSEKLQQASQ